MKNLFFAISYSALQAVAAFGVTIVMAREVDPFFSLFVGPKLGAMLVQIIDGGWSSVSLVLGTHLGLTYISYIQTLSFKSINRHIVPFFNSFGPIFFVSGLTNNLGFHGPCALSRGGF